MQACGCETLLQEMGEDLHDLCQPLTALQCRLETARMEQARADEGSRLLLDTVADGLIETKRMFAIVAAMRERLISQETSQEISEETSEGAKE